MIPRSAPFLLAFLCATASATVRYVDINSTNATAPYTNWATAATIIQDAVDVAAYPDEIVVADGVYSTGGRSINGLANRVVVTKRLTLRSVNGPARTIIAGARDPVSTNGDAAIRCVYLSSASVLSGFTLTNGATTTATALPIQNSGGGVYCNSSQEVVTNCILTGNFALNYGGGAYQGHLINCTLTGNSADSGGGIAGSSPAFALVDNCVIASNSACNGGGTWNADQANCNLSGNRADFYGGAALGGSLHNCTLIDNSAMYGGGASGANLYNCAVYFNRGGGSTANYDTSCRLSHCCTTPLPGTGVGNIDSDPQLASLSHLSTGSPCRGAGLLPAILSDLDGELWANPPSIGCDEYRPGTITGPLTVAISAPFTNFAVGYPAEFITSVEGRTTTSIWNFGTGDTVTNRPLVTHSWTVPGVYQVLLTAYNEEHPQGVSATISVWVEAAPVYYVSPGSTNPVPPYSSWDTASTSIQPAIDAASLRGSLVLVNDGIYETGGRPVYGALTNRIVVDKAITLRSLHGPACTFIKGSQVAGTTIGDSAVRCAYLANGATLSGFTLTNGATRSRSASYVAEFSGGGVWCNSAVITNCVLAGNAAYENAGGAASGTLQNCVLTGNSAGGNGGGADSATLNNCVLSGNRARLGAGACNATCNNCTITQNTAQNAGGGTWGGVLNNSIAFFNAAGFVGNANYSSGVLNYCCTTPLPIDGIGNFTNQPLFVNLIDGDFHLESDSPCINAGRNASVFGLSDLEGAPRVSAGTVDLGAYEFQSPASAISYAWLRRFGLPDDGSADRLDPDGDGMTNLQEWMADTDPTNSSSLLLLLAPAVASSSVTVTWQSSTNRTYVLECSTNPIAPCFLPVARNVSGRFGLTSFTNNRSLSGGSALYRVAVEHP